MKPKIILVDDHELFRSGLKSMLEHKGIATVLAEAENGKVFLKLLDSFEPDLVLMDIEMPEMNGIEAAKEAIKRYPGLKILILSIFGDEHNYYKIIEAGAKGFLLKTASCNEFENAIQTVSKGDNFFSNELLRKIIIKIGTLKHTVSGNKTVIFNEAEVDIMYYMCQGFSNDEIAEKLCLSAKTIANYRTKLLNKTGCKNSTNLVAYAIKNQIVEI